MALAVDVAFEAAMARSPHTQAAAVEANPSGGCAGPTRPPAGPAACQPT